MDNTTHAEIRTLDLGTGVSTFLYIRSNTLIHIQLFDKDDNLIREIVEVVQPVQPPK